MSEKRVIEPTIFISNKLFIQQLKSFRFIFIFSVFLFLSIAWLFNRYSTREYEVYAVIRSTRNELTSMLGSSDLFRGMEAFQAYNDIEDGMTNLRSFSMINSTLDKLNFEVSYFTEIDGIIKIRREIYHNTPIKVIINKTHVQPLNSKFYIDILSDTTYRMYVDEPSAIIFSYLDNEVVNEEFAIKHDKVYRFNENIDLEYLNFSITKNIEYEAGSTDKKNKFFFELYDLGVMTKNYLKKINVARNPSSSIIRISLRDKNLEKAITLLNNYLNFYFEDNLARKNNIALNTINFIDSQISGISDSLTRSESDLESFRTNYQIMNLSYQGQLSIDDLELIEEQQSALETQERYYDYILEYLRTTEDLSGIIPPSSMNVNNVLINNLIGDLLSLNTQRNNIISQRGQNNPFLDEVENRIRLQKQNIIEVVSSNLITLRQSLSDLNYRAEKLRKEIAALPKRELNMASIKRRFDIDDAIYTYLLQKRSEATITMASNYPDFEILEPARAVTSYQAAPKKLFNYLVALILGIGIPGSVLILRNILNFRITNTEFIQNVINRPPLSSIFSNPRRSENILIDYPVSICSESIRTLRSNLFRKLKEPGSKVILVTSPQPKDGKSFIATNLAISIALVGKKVLIIDIDLKRPVLHQKFELKNGKGLTNYIAGASPIEDVLHKTKIDNLYFISSGPKLANATEIFESGGLDTLFKDARENYDYIILDTSPVGFIADALFMTRYADQILLVVRHNSTLKESFIETIDSFNINKINNYEIVFNDKSLKESPHGYYSKYYAKDKKA